MVLVYTAYLGLTPAVFRSHMGCKNLWWGEETHTKGSIQPQDTPSLLSEEYGFRMALGTHSPQESEDCHHFPV
jgi:hypothetical protein